MQPLQGVASMKVGVLSIQGGFSEHVSHLRRISELISVNNGVCGPKDPVRVVEIRTVEELEGVDGLIIPGAETTVISVFLEANNFQLLNALKKFGQSGKPIFGTCAGLILLANGVEGQMKSGQLLIGGMDIEVCRNFHGSQKDSFEATLNVEDELLLSTRAHPMIFIRAPGIKAMDASKVTTLAKFNDLPVAVRQGNYLAMSFHPELTNDLTWHLYFVKMVSEFKNSNK